jgi:HSP20 family protein
MDSSHHKYLINTFFDMQRAMEQLELFFDEDLYSDEGDEDNDFYDLWEENYEEEGESHEEVVPYHRGSGQDCPTKRGSGKNKNRVSSRQDGLEPATDIYETPEAFKLIVELPGYDKKNIKIDMPNNRTLTLEGTRSPGDVKKLQRRKSTGSYIPNEKRGGQGRKGSGPKNSMQKRNPSIHNFSRSFEFPIPLNGDQIKASLENGLLNINIRKYNKAQIKEIQID